MATATDLVCASASAHKCNVAHRPTQIPYLAEDDLPHEVDDVSANESATDVRMDSMLLEIDDRPAQGARGGVT